MSGARRLARLALTGILAASGCSEAPQSAPYSLLLLSADTLRPDYLGFNGYDRPSSPNLDALLRRGFYFEAAVAPVARTTPALASLLVGAYPHTTGVRGLTDTLSPDVVPIAERLRDAGYQTLAVVSNQLLGHRRDLDRGFAIYDFAGDARGAPETTDAALSHLEFTDPSRPLFAWVHYIDPHVPYHSEPDIIRSFDPGYEGRYALRFGWRPDSRSEGERLEPFPPDLPKGEATHANPLPESVNAHIRRLYAADIRAMDRELGRLLEAFEAARGQDGIVVFTADHGESLGEHDFYFDHGDYVYNAGTRVPLAFVLPERHPLHGSGRCGGWVSLVDVVPTLLELLALPGATPPTDDLEGRSLSACLRGEELAEEPVFAESGRSYYFDRVKRRRRNDVAGRFRAVVKGRYKLIFTPFADEAEAYELYDVAADPHETRDLYRPQHPALPDLRAALEAWMARQGDLEDAPKLAPEDRDALRSLGYLE